MNRLLLTALAVSLLWSCSGSDGLDPVEIRVRNASSAVMESVVITFPGRGRAGDPVGPADAESGAVEYGTVDPGEATDYRRIAAAYRYAPVSLRIDGTEHGLQPDDYVGEALLEAGRYTYVLHYEAGSLALTLDRD